MVQASHTSAAEAAPAQSKKGPPSKQHSKEAPAGKPSPGAADGPAAIPQEDPKPSSTPAVAAHAAAEKSASGVPPATADSVQDGDGKESAANQDAELPTTLAYPADIFGPDYRPSVLR